MSPLFKLDSACGQALIVRSASVDEHLGRLSLARVEALCVDRAIDLRVLLGTPMCLSIIPDRGDPRYVHGIVAEAEQAGEVRTDEASLAIYRFAVTPRPWLLRRTFDSRIYRDMSVPAIVRHVLGESGYTDVEMRLAIDYPVREYRVQYRESHFDFISRLMEEEGIYYYFEHARDRHTMVLADALGAHAPIPGGALHFVPPMHRGHRHDATIDTWTMARTATPGRVCLGDYDYLRPAAPLSADRAIEDAEGGGLAALDVFDFPGAGAAHAQDGIDLERRALVRGEALNVARSVSSGTTDSPGLVPGCLFTLRDHPVPSANREYLVVATGIEAVGIAHRSGEANEEAPPRFRCAFRAIASDQPYRSPQTTPRPAIHGLQTAIVDGPSDEAIAVDRHGRVQVKFFWSGNGGREAAPSCPVRVASPWAGKGWGMSHVPRVGQEVVVSFLDGDPDRPLIIGSVYNQDHMPPYPLPENGALSGIVSRSVGGGRDDANELRFDDRPGQEELYLHAQRDLRQEAENDRFLQVGRDATEESGRDLKRKTGRDRSQETGRDDTLKVGRRLRIEAREQVELTVGPARLVMKCTGEIQLTGTTVKIDALASANVSAAASLALNAGAAASIKAGAAVSVSGGAAVSVNAGAVLSLTAVGPAMLKGLPPLVG